MKKIIIIGLVIAGAFLILVQFPAIKEAIFSSKSSKTEYDDGMDDLIALGEKITNDDFVYEQYIDPLYKLIKQKGNVAIKDMEFKHNQLIIVYEDPDKASFKSLTSTAGFLLGVSAAFLIKYKLDQNIDTILVISPIDETRQGVVVAPMDGIRKFNNKEISELEFF